MRKHALLLTALFSLLLVAGISSCRKTIEVGNKPKLEFIPGPEMLISDATLPRDKKYMIQVEATNAEDQTPNVYFEVVRTYSGTADTTVFEKFLEGSEQGVYRYTHTFTTLKTPGTERYTFTVRNNYGIVGQKVLVMTVK